jgi:hypothetical protein
MKNSSRVSGRAEERQLAKTEHIGESVIQGFALVLEGSRCDNKGKGIFAWVPSLREWLKDPDYVFWLDVERK